LKLHAQTPAAHGPAVAPHAGAWIETIVLRLATALGISSRPPRGGVD